MSREQKIKDREKLNNSQVLMSHSEKVAASREARELQRKKRSFIICLISVFIALVLGAVLCLTIFFPIENIVVTSSVANAKKVSNYYSEEDIISASGIEKEKNLILTNVDDAAKSVEKQLPYIGYAQITRKFPNTLVITVTDSRADFAVSHGNNFILFNKAGKVLDNKAEKRPEKCAVIEGVKIASSTISEKVTFTDSSVQGYLNSMIEAFDKYGFNSVTKINFSNILNIKFVCDNAVTFVLGSVNDLDSKIRMAKETYKTEIEKGISNPIIVDLSVEKKAYVRPDGKLEEIEKTTVAPEPVSEVEKITVKETDDTPEDSEEPEDSPDENNEDSDENRENEEVGHAYG